MNSIISRLRTMFGGEKTQEESSPNTEQATVSMRPPMDEVVPSTPVETASSESSADEGKSSDNFPEKPPQRTVIQPNIIATEDGSGDTDEILIKAQPSAMMDQCKFMVNRNLFKGYSWFFPNFESAADSPLAEAIFSVDGVETVLVHESTVTITRMDKSSADWRPLAKEVGAAIRAALQSQSPLVSDEVKNQLPAEEDVRAKIQEVIDQEVNPGVAGHGGHITLTQVEGNTVTIQMGGGCQGCSAADLTLKQGIHGAFRKALPTVGAIYDETDHKSGLNPYYS